MEGKQIWGVERIERYMLKQEKNITNEGKRYDVERREERIKEGYEWHATPVLDIPGELTNFN